VEGEGGRTEDCDEDEEERLDHFGDFLFVLRFEVGVVAMFRAHVW
jgi:hypothetical protein